MDLMRRRREMMKVKPYWDVILVPEANGAIKGYGVNAKAAQKIIIEYAPASQGKYVWRTETANALSPRTSGQTSRAEGAICPITGGTVIIEVLLDCTISFGNRTVGATSTYYGFNGEYIKIKIM